LPGLFRIDESTLIVSVMPIPLLTLSAIPMCCSGDSLIA
jgi:hypothetical protein